MTPCRDALQVFSASLRIPARRYGYRGLKIFTSLALRFQDFQRRSENQKLSLTVLRITTLITLGCMALLSLSDWLKLPDPIGLYVFYATVIFGITCLAELLYQSIEFTAVKLSHESNYYWASLIALIAIAAIQNPSLLGYAGGFFMALLLRATISRLIQAL
ncbi:hypothetical protein [Methylomonas albis]|uniref:Uncharacterized protein n=1 Tax=Methylomonas albis TaxID=1854563 RepID=A0ABR9D1V3_9GAMM|nr:hypothetical protein [Methylomonas albis]MBD9356228.1 hypothetical protein [Methylomonas albis]